jgi:hypothetical protein
MNGVETAVIDLIAKALQRCAAIGAGNVTPIKSVYVVYDVIDDTPIGWIEFYGQMCRLRQTARANAISGLKRPIETFDLNDPSSLDKITWQAVSMWDYPKPNHDVPSSPTDMLIDAVLKESGFTYIYHGYNYFSTWNPALERVDGSKSNIINVMCDVDKSEICCHHVHYHETAISRSWAEHDVRFELGDPTLHEKMVKYLRERLSDPV